MLEFKQDDISAELILTLTENVSIQNPYYLFVFTHVLTKETVAFVLSTADDESFYTERYNMFTINPAVLFAGKQPGEWHYAIYQQAGSDSIDVALTLGELENGKMMLLRDVDFSFAKYESETSFKTYNG
jgi:hypothetical protein